MQYKLRKSTWMEFLRVSIVECRYCAGDVPHVGSMIEGMTVTAAGEGDDGCTGKTVGDTTIMSPMEFMELLLRDNQGIMYLQTRK